MEEEKWLELWNVAESAKWKESYANGVKELKKETANMVRG